MRAGEMIVALPNDGAAHIAILETPTKTRCEARIVETTWPVVEPAIPVTVAQALPKTLEKLEWVLQHGTEIGVARYIVFSSSRSRADADRLERKIDRWRQIVKGAAEQSGRARLPVVAGPMDFAAMLAQRSSEDLGLMAYEGERAATLRVALADVKPPSVTIIVGPEGGFSDDEVGQAVESGVRAITLGPRILRTETAALSAVSQIFYALDADKGASMKVS
jgi:16S rRNA (uracil1498-N3)-methyltransferase